MSVARFIADQRTFYRVPVAVCCAILGLSVGWFYKWVKAPVTAQTRRRRELDAKVRALFSASERTYGSPRIHRDLLEAGWAVGVNTVADSMQRQGLFGRKPKRRKGLTKQDREAPKFPDLLKRDFTAPAPNVTWCGDITEIPTGEGKLYLATVLDLYSRRLLACPISEHPTPCSPPTRSRSLPRPVAGASHRRCRVPHRPRLDLHREHAIPSNDGAQRSKDQPSAPPIDDHLGRHFCLPAKRPDLACRVCGRQAKPCLVPATSRRRLPVDNVSRDDFLARPHGTAHTLSSQSWSWSASTCWGPHRHFMYGIRTGLGWWTSWGDSVARARAIWIGRFLRAREL